MLYWWEIHLWKNFLESLECFGKLSTKGNDNGWVESSCCRKYILDSTKERIVRLSYSFFWQLIHLKISILSLYKAEIDAFNMNKMLYGILIELESIWQQNHWKIIIYALHKVYMIGFRVDEVLYGIIIFLLISWLILNLQVANLQNLMFL